MIIRSTAALGALSIALTAAPATAQDAPEMSYETATYAAGQQVANEEYETVIMRQEPVVQPLPTTEYTYAEPAPQAYAHPQVDTHATPTQHYAPAPVAAPMHHATQYAGHHAPAPHGTYPQQAAAYPPQPRFDREEWLDECRARYKRGDSKGGILGALLGAVGGGIAGNRIADGERLGGTLIGAGIGGLAGAAIGSVISGSGKRRAKKECEAWLDQYYGGGYRGGYYQPQAYTYVYTMQPVLVAVPQKRIVREYVTEEWVTETVHVPQTTYVPAKRKVVREKRVKTTPTKRIKYSK
ncbi:glycine zipper 2TM domain-containing protein [Altererythrobacter sp. ZODW24]|uniref:glycine zipper 2TM domain-containing protein n=1 Tax=Altererythrobacter sp. ZODW24 TaxID=2185142 RepID=UPI000DF7B4F8|nr:glycine zipper 2TM domain-containing protein [Altererythrobacter sp. ZODW24]